MNEIQPKRKVVIIHRRPEMTKDNVIKFINAYTVISSLSDEELKKIFEKSFKEANPGWEVIEVKVET